MIFFYDLDIKRHDVKVKGYDCHVPVFDTCRNGFFFYNPSGSVKCLICISEIVQY